MAISRPDPRTAAGPAPTAALAPVASVVPSAGASPPAGAPPRVRAGIFLLSLAGLLFQVALTRLASAALNYHLTFLAVGAGVLGVGIGATWIACARPAGSGDRNVTLRRLALGAAAGMALLVAGFAWLPLGRSGGPGLLVLILLAYPALIAPYVCVGAAVTLALRSWPRQAGGLYGADLLGAGAGCLLAVPLMDALGPPLAAGTAAMAAACDGVPPGPPAGRDGPGRCRRRRPGPARRGRRRGPRRRRAERPPG